MARQTGRKPGQEDITQHTRKGIAGDALVMLGYEQDRNWVDKYEYIPV